MASPTRSTPIHLQQQWLKGSAVERAEEGKAGANAAPTGSLKLVVNRTLGDLETEASEAVETKATNEHINDDGSAQKLTYVDIQELKKQGLSGREIIEQQLAGSESFANRTVYSQPSMWRARSRSISSFSRRSSRTLAMCVTFGSKSPPTRSATFAAMRSARCSRSAAFVPVDATLSSTVSRVFLSARCSRGSVETGRWWRSTMPSRHRHSTFCRTSTLRPRSRGTCSRWCTGLRRSVTMRLCFRSRTCRAPRRGWGSCRQGGQVTRARKRQANFREVDRVRTDFFAGDFDAVLIACHYDPVSILNRLKPHLGGSASIVVHSPYVQPLVEAHATLRSDEEFINISVTEPWLRKYQVLPGRTHPEMTTSSTAGFILHAIRVFGEAQAVQMRAEYLAALESQKHADAEHEQAAQGAKRAQPQDEAADQEQPETKRVKVDETCPRKQTRACKMRRMHSRWARNIATINGIAHAYIQSKTAVCKCD